MHHRVLLVDDEANLLMGLERVLCREPYNIITAQSGNEALTLLKRTPVDVVVSDQDMPGMKGTEFLGRVHEIYPETIRFMLTGKATLEVAIQAINEGAISRFFTKPCNGTDLAAAIRQALQQKALMDQARRLLLRVKQQSAVLKRLEQENPGMTHVERDAQGAICIDDVPNDIDELVQESQQALEQEGTSHEAQQMAAELEKP